MAIERPDKALWKYYLPKCLAIPPLFPILVLLTYFRYHTMRYKFTEEGISMSWGILFRHEIILNYARIQDIHLRSSVVESWLGLARVLIQTASSSSAAEMTIEGIRVFQEVRDFLYSRMRGVKDTVHHRPSPLSQAAGPANEVPENAELVLTLRELANEFRALRLTIENKSVAGPPNKGEQHV
jgi:uncharacterized protein